MYMIKLACAFVLNLAHQTTAWNLTTYKCLHNDLTGVDCLKSTIPRLPSILAQEIDPLHIPLSSVSRTTEDYSIEFSNIVFTGTSNLTITEKEVENNGVNFDLDFPILKYNSSAVGGGIFKGFKFQGSAKLLIDFYDVVLNLKLENTLNVEVKDLNFSRMIINVILFNRDPKRNEAFNKLVNEASDLLYDDYKEVLEKSFGRFLPAFIEKIYTREGDLLVFKLNV